MESLDNLRVWKTLDHNPKYYSLMPCPTQNIKIGVNKSKDIGNMSPVAIKICFK